MQWSFSEPKKIIIDLEKNKVKIYYTNDTVLNKKDVYIDTNKLLNLIHYVID